jgi:hypothetical protein
MKLMMMDISTIFSTGVEVFHQAMAVILDMEWDHLNLDTECHRVHTAAIRMELDPLVIIRQ